jgi:hypothetical protein
MEGISMNIEEILKEIGKNSNPSKNSNPKSLLNEKEVEVIKAACKLIASATSIKADKVAKLMKEDPGFLSGYVGIHLAAKVLIDACGLAYEFDTGEFYNDDED